MSVRYGDIKIASNSISGDTLPIGCISGYAGSDTPENWLKCDGSAVSRTLYIDLFNKIGTTYGVGDGSTTFNLPDLKGKVMVGQDSSQTEFDVLGETGGEKTHKLTIPEMPTHSHDFLYTELATAFATTGFAGSTNSNVSKISSFAINSTGGDGYHNNLQPYTVVNYIIKAKQSIGLVGKVLDVESTSTKDSYSCEYINEVITKGNYSASETITINPATNVSVSYLVGTITTKGGDLLIQASAIGLYTSSGNSRIGVYFNGGLAETICTTNCTSAYFSGANGSLIKRNIPAGTHSIGIFISPDSPANTANLRPYNTISLSVIEL